MHKRYVYIQISRRGKTIRLTKHDGLRIKPRLQIAKVEINADYKGFSAE